MSIGYEASEMHTPSMFQLGEEVSWQDIRRVVAPQNTPDNVERARLEMVGTHVNELLRADLTPEEADVHLNFIHSLGAEAVLAYLPGGDLNDALKE